ncbi:MULTISPECIES: acyl-CoA dehydrogenase type 2 [Streptomyces]|uniref:Acyl-CoA dehydrogenase type 2 n=1 Tax=Streptomyces sviceus (strain ATCC 29083 / DSM 924 / JCM 4929 / NBRC 13980 / NCIMB 11184 / NRRL 5439 / UC 5370) TaxID=463191 RepID=B5I3W7_STRX2|nr:MULTISPECIES: acyl-CoA dehydrogenase type 2 [Streptomyces]EDY59772.1 acyl-CoA dehydrogenase type 2 [Streptomyces sviceus ATCC 29083]MYT03900.1 acyl-CoA dehydrogenase [Streptomyces sp. SID5470]
MTAVPEPGLTEREIIERAAALRPALLARQAETERLTHCPEVTHDDFLRAGFYRILQPRRYGGHEFALPVFYRVIVEIARGCPSTGWALSLTAAHVLQVCSVFDEKAQDELFALDGDFRAASTVAPVGVARPDGPDHVVLDGTWPYSSGAPYSTHYVGQTLRAPEKPGDPPGPPVLFVAPRSVWTVLDDWHGTLGLRGTGSNSIRMEQARIPLHFTRETSLLDLPVEGGSVGSELHGNPMYAGRAPSFFHGELAAVMIGTAYAAADEYARIVAARPLLLEPDRTRADLHDYQRHLGEALGVIHLAEAALRQTAEDWMEACRRNVNGEAPFTTAVDNRLALTFLNAGRMAWDVLQGILFRTAGSRHARDGERMQRYFRDAATYWTHVGPGMYEPLLRRVGCDTLGLPSEHIALIP